MKFYRKPKVSYWSNSKFIASIRKFSKVEKPKSATMDEWANYHKQVKQTKSFILWFTEEFVDDLQKWISFPTDCIYSFKVFYKNWKGKTHVLDGGLEVGKWYDFSSRIPLCLFGELEKFIEKEKGFETLAWEKELIYDENWGVQKDNPEYGKLTLQAVSAIEQEEIYSWWKKNKDRDFSVESGLEEIFSNHKGGMWDFPRDENYYNAQQLHDELVMKYKEEEEEMLIRLIKIRNHLWS